MLLDVLSGNGEMTLNRCSKLSGIPRIEASRLLADFIRFDLVEQIFVGHTFYFRIKEDSSNR